MTTVVADLRVLPGVEADRPDWDAFVTGRAEADVLQAWAWGEVMAGEGEPPARLLVRSEDGRLRGVAQALVRRTSLGRSILYVPHGPIWEREGADGEAILASLLGALREQARAARGIVVKLDPRARPDPEGGSDGAALADALRQASLRAARFDLQARTTRVVNLSPDPAVRQAGWTSNARNCARRATREGTTATVLRTPDRAAIGPFAELHARTARGRFRGHPPAFFERLATAIAPAGGWYLVTAALGSRLIAGMVVLRLADRAYYLYGASDRAAPPHSYGAYAAMAAAFDALAEDGVRTFDLWGVAEPDDHDADPSWAGFSAFKRHFDGAPLRHPGTFDLVVDPLWWRLRDLRERWTAR